MSKSHIKSELYLDSIIPVDGDTAEIFHYDISPNGALNDTEPVDSLYGDSLVLWLEMNNLNSTSTYVLDKSRYGNHAKINGPTVANGRNGKTLSFDGNDDFLELVSPLQIYNTSFTIAMWVKFTEDNREILFGDYGIPGYCGVNFEKYLTGALRLYWNGAPDIFTGNIVPIGSWCHLAVARDKVANNVVFYVNGTASYTYTGALTDITTTVKQYIGRDSRTGVTTMNGQIDSLRIYNKALTAAEMSYLYNQSVYSIVPSGKYGNAIAIEEATTNMYPGPATKGMYMTSVYGNGSYGFGAATNSKWEIDNSLQLFTGIDVQKVSRINSGVNQSFYVHWTDLVTRTGATFIPGEERTISLYYYGTYGTRINPYLGGQTGSLLLYADNAISGNGTTSITLPVEENKWCRIVFRIKNTGTTDAVYNYGWMVLHANTTTCTLDSTQFWAFTGMQVEKKSFATSFINGSRVDGKLAYINPIPGASNFTISFWIKLLNAPSSGTTQESILTLNNGTDVNGLYIDVVNNTNLRFFTYNSAGVASVATTASWARNQWMHVVVVRDNSNLYGYVYGEERCRIANTGTVNLDGILTLGTRNAASARANILIDELRIDRVARPIEEVVGWYLSGNPFAPKGNEIICL